VAVAVVLFEDQLRWPRHDPTFPSVGHHSGAGEKINKLVSRLQIEQGEKPSAKLLWLGSGKAAPKCYVSRHPIPHSVLLTGTASAATPDDRLPSVCDPDVGLEDCKRLNPR